MSLVETGQLPGASPYPTQGPLEQDLRLQNRSSQFYSRSWSARCVVVGARRQEGRMAQFCLRPWESHNLGVRPVCRPIHLQLCLASSHPKLFKQSYPTTPSMRFLHHSYAVSMWKATKHALIGTFAHQGSSGEMSLLLVHAVSACFPALSANSADGRQLLPVRWLGVLPFYSLSPNIQPWDRHGSNFCFWGLPRALVACL